MKTKVSLMIVENEKQFVETFLPSDNIWWVIGMSYLDEQKYLKDKNLLTESEEIIHEGVCYLLEKIENHPLIEQNMRKFYERHKDELYEDYEAWRNVWIIKHKEMVKFWKEAKRKGSNVYFRIGKY